MSSLIKIQSENDNREPIHVGNCANVTALIECRANIFVVLDRSLLYSSIATGNLRNIASIALALGSLELCLLVSHYHRILKQAKERM